MQFERLTDFAGMEEHPAISPDGKSVAFTRDAGGLRQIWVRLLGGGPSATLPRDAAVQLGGHRYDVGPHGRVTVTVRFARAGRVPMRATARGALPARLMLIFRAPARSRHARPRE